MRNVLITFLLCLATISSYAQDNSGVKFELSGFVRADAFVDTRQTVSLRDNAIIVAPAEKSLDKNQDDINARTNTTMLAFHTRLGGKASGIEALGAKVIGYMEGEFFGMSDNDINGFRLRHAYIKFDWGHSTLLFGQYWHPMFQTDMIPSFSFAAPFIPYSRNPQIRYTHTHDEFNFSLTAMTQRDFLSNGPNQKSNVYLKNAALPMLDAEIFFKTKSLYAGVGGGYKSLLPSPTTSTGLKSTETINSFTTTAYGKFLFNDEANLKLQFVYGQNMVDMTMNGGYATLANNPDKYTNMSAMTVWGEFSYGKTTTYNLFLGYSKYLGADDNIGTVYGFLNNGVTGLDNLLRIAPNVSFNFSKLKCTLEVNVDNATYGTVNKADKGKITNTYTVTNVRPLFAMIYAF